MGWTFRLILNLSFHDWVSWTYYGLMNFFFTFHLSMTSSKIQSRMFLLSYKLNYIRLLALFHVGYLIHTLFVCNTITPLTMVFFIFFLPWILIDIWICMCLSTGKKILFVYFSPWECSSFIWDLEIVCSYKFFLFIFWNLYASLIKEFMLFAYLRFPWHGLLFCNLFIDLLP